VIGDALAGLRARRSRTLLAALGIVAAALVVGTATTVGYSLATGFDRSADRADLPDIVARFSRDDEAKVDARVRALPNLAARSYRAERTNTLLSSGSHETRKGAIDFVLGGRRGYLITAGHDLTGAPGEVVIERGLAQEWGLKPGDRLRVGRLAQLDVVGVAVSPDNVAFPLAGAARVYVSPEWLDFRPQPNVALLWLNDPSKADVTLTQARAVSFGLGRLQFITRSGVRILLSQAAGIVISLLVAFSLVALVAAGTMLAAGAHADVQRRLPAFGVQRALGFTPARIAALQATEAALLAIPAAALGIGLGAALVARPAGDLLAALNELSPGWALVPPLALCLVAVVLVVVAAATWPAWRAARRPPVEILRGGDVASAARRRRWRGPSPAATATPPATAVSPPATTRSPPLAALGARFATAARGRWVAAVATIAVCAGVVTLMLALASLLERLRSDPGTVGKKYQLSLTLDSNLIADAAKVPGVAAVGRRYQVDAADSFRLGEPVRLIAYPGDHTEFEAPPLAEGRRIRSTSDIEVGQGMADALGLSPGSVFAAQLPGGEEVRFRVSGVVRALENDGRIAWVRPDRLVVREPDLQPQVVVRLGAGANRDAVVRRLEDLGARLQPVGAAQTDNARFLAVLAAVLRGVGLAVGLVCLYALIQALTVTARERRGAVALLRACGADAATVALVLAGAAGAVAIPAAIGGVLLETLAFGPLVARLAAGFASLPLAPTTGQVALVVAGLLALAAAATAIVARRVLKEPIVAGLREE
jgi:ABC-type antimicrobial peptide transport system permease subunit